MAQAGVPVFYYISRYLTDKYLDIVWGYFSKNSPPQNSIFRMAKAGKLSDFNIKGGESSSQFQWFTIAKIKLQFLIFFVLILGLQLQRYSTNTKRYPPTKSFWKL